MLRRDFIQNGRALAVTPNQAWSPISVMDIKFFCSAESGIEAAREFDEAFRSEGQMSKVGCLSLFALLIASPSWAVPITMIHIADGGSFPGSLDPDGGGPIAPVPFEVDHFTITGQGDTSNRFTDGFSLFGIEHSSAQIEIPGVGTFEFLIPTFTVVAGAIPAALFLVDPGFVVVEGPENPAFATYDLSSSVGPIFGEVRLIQWTVVDVMTSGGVLVFENRVARNGSFEAIVDAAVPEPGTLAILALGLLALERSLRRGRRS